MRIRQALGYALHACLPAERAATLDEVLMRADPTLPVEVRTRIKPLEYEDSRCGYWVKADRYSIDVTAARADGRRVRFTQPIGTFTLDATMRPGNGVALVEYTRFKERLDGFLDALLFYAHGKAPGLSCELCADEPTLRERGRYERPAAAPVLLLDEYI